MSSDAVADDELPSLFADDDNDTEEQDRSTNSTLRFASAQPLSADEFAELLRAIENGEQSPLPLQDQEEQQPQLASSARQAPIRQRLLLLQTPGGKAVAALQKKKVSSKLSNKARDGRKEELVYLRKTVLGLETQLHKLLHASHKRITAVAESPHLVIPEQQQQQQLNSYYYKSRSMQQSSQFQVGTVESATGRSGLWREIARHQRDERDRSERENIRLRLVLESQLKVAKSLEKFLLLKTSASTTVRCLCRALVLSRLGINLVSLITP